LFDLDANEWPVGVPHSGHEPRVGLRKESEEGAHWEILNRGTAHARSWEWLMRVTAANLDAEFATVMSTAEVCAALA